MADFPGFISTLKINPSTSDQMEDGVDFIHSGIIKALNTADAGSFIAWGMKVTSNSNGTFDVDAGGYFDKGEYKAFSAVTGQSSSDFTGHANYDWYGFIVINNGSLAFRGTNAFGASAAKTADLNDGDIPLCVVQLAKGSDATEQRKIQSVGIKKLKSSLSIGEDTSSDGTYNEKLKINSDGTVELTGNSGKISFPTVGSTNSTLYSTNDKGISNGNVLVANANVADNDFLKVDGTSIEGRTAAEVKSDLALVKGDVGLGNVDNTTDAAKQAATLSAATATDVGLGNVTNESKATMFTSPTFTGTIAIPNIANLETAVAANTAKTVRTDSEINALAQAKVDAVIDSAPGALNTLNELAAALGDDASYATTITNQMATKTKTFKQDDIPTSTAVGDLWIDTNDNNKLYHAHIVGADQITAGEWVEVTVGKAALGLVKGDVGLGSVLNQAQIKTFKQDAIPTSTAIGDQWYDTNDSNKLYVAESAGATSITSSGGGGWVLIALTKTTVGLSDLDSLEAGTGTKLAGIAAGATVGATTSQANEITANTAKVGITTSQANAITANTAKVSYEFDSATDLGTAGDIDNDVIPIYDDGASAYKKVKMKDFLAKITSSQVVGTGKIWTNTLPADGATVGATMGSSGNLLLENGSTKATEATILNANTTKADVGLGSVDNTADTAKPVSTAQQTALDAKVPTTRTIAGRALSNNLVVRVNATSGKLEINDGSNTTTIQDTAGTPVDVVFDNRKTEWAEIQDGSSNKPANNATVGAVLGTNLKAADGSTTLGDADVKNASIVSSHVVGSGKLWAGTLPEDGATKGKTFRQDGIPTSTNAGDLWVDTNDSNKIYQAGVAGADQITSGEWELLGYAAAEANATANTGDVAKTGTINANEYARWSDATTLEARTPAEVRSDLGIADNEIIDWTASSAGTIHSSNYTDTNTTYSAGTGLSLTGTTFSTNLSASEIPNLAASKITSGTFATARIADDAITTAKIADDQITNALMADDAIDSAQLADASIDEVHLNATNSPTDNHILSYDATSSGFTWVAAGSGEANEYSFKTISVSGQDDVVADTTTDTLTLAGGSNVTITTTAASDTISIASTDTNTWRGITAGGNTLGSSETLAFTAGSNVTITESGGAVTIASTDTNTTYSVGDGGLTQNNFTNTLKTKLDGIEASADVTDAANVRTALNNAMASNTLTIGDGSTTTTFPGSIVVTGTTTTNNVETVSTSNGVIFEGNAADANEVTLLAGTVSGDRTITLPDATGTVLLTDGSGASLTALNASEITSGTIAAARVATLNQNTTGSAATLATARNFSLTGDVTASAVSFDGSGAVALSTSLASNSVDSAELVDGSIDESHLNATNTPSDNQILSYDDSTSGFTWVNAGSGEANQTITTGSGIDGADSGSTGNITLALGIQELSDVQIASGDKLLVLDSDGSTHQLESIDDIATLFAGSNLTATNGVLAVDDAFLKNNANDTTSGTITAGGFTTAGSITLGGHSFNDIDITSEASDADDHLMTALAIKNRIEDYGYSTTTGTVTSVGTNTGLSGTVTSSGSLSLALGDLADMTQSWVTGEDEFIVLDNGTQKRKLSSEIFGSNAFNSTTIPTNNNQLTNGASFITASSLDTLTNKTIAASQVTEISNLTEDEGAQLENIGSTTISAAQWGYLGAASGAITNTDTNYYTTGLGLSSGTLTATVSGASNPTVDLSGLYTAGTNLSRSGTTLNVDTALTGLTDLDLTAANHTIFDTVGANTLTIGASDTTITIAGDLTVSGDTTTVNTATLSVEDPLVYLANGQSGIPSVDIGIIGERGSAANVGFIWDESADQWAAITTTDTGTTAGNVSISSYANLRVGTITGNITGDVTGDLTGTADTVQDAAITNAKLAASGLSASKLTTGTLPDARYDSGIAEIDGKGAEQEFSVQIEKAMDAEDIWIVLSSTNEAKFSSKLGEILTIENEEVRVISLASTESSTPTNNAGDAVNNGLKVTRAARGTSAATHNVNTALKPDKNRTIQITKTDASSSTEKGFIPEFSGADANVASVTGLVPQAAIGDQAKYLRGDGTWQTLSGAGSTGTVTQIVAGTGLSGGTITTTGTIAVSGAQTGITTDYNTGRIIGRDADNNIDFTTDNQIHFKTNGETPVIKMKASGEIEATSLDISGDADIDGTLEADAITIGGTAIGSIYSPVAGHSSIATVGTITTGTWNGTAIASGYIAADAITGAKIADDAIDSEHIAAGAVDLEHLSSESVDEDNLYISNAGSDGQFLQKQSGNNGGLTWATVSSGDSNAGGVDGSAGSPTFSFTNDSNTGMYSKAADSIGFSLGATEVFSMSSSGAINVENNYKLGISDGGASNPTLRFKDDTDTGIYRPASGQLAFTSDGTAQVIFKDGVIEPVTDNDVDIGSSSLEFKDGYFDGTLHCDVLDLAGTEYTSIGGASVLNELTDVTMDATNFANGLLIQPDSDGSAPSTGTLSSASDNIGIGRDVFNSLTSGSENYVIGSLAGYAITSGSKNVLMGKQAGEDITTDTGNTILGYRAGQNITSDYNVAMGYNALQGNASTALTGDYNVAIGYQTLQSVEAASIGSIAIGRDALKDVTTSDYNIAVGYEAGKSITTGPYNVAIGYRALDALTTNGYNVAVGMAALGQCTSGNNVAVGADAGRVLTSGIQNVFVGYATGYYATSSANTLIGYGAGDNVTTGGNNTLIGVTAGGAINTGTDNIMLGRNAGDNITSGDNNVIIGAIDADSATADDQLIIASGDGGVTWIKGNSSGNVLLNQLADVVSVSGNTTLTQAQSGSYVYWTSGTLTLPDGCAAGTQFTIFNNTQSSATVGLNTNGVMNIGWASNAAVADNDATSYVCTSEAAGASYWVQVGA